MHVAHVTCFIIVHAASYLLVPCVIELLKRQTTMELSELSPYNLSNEIHLRAYNERLPVVYQTRLFDVNLTIREISAAYKDRAGYFSSDTQSIFVLSRFIQACTYQYYPGFEPSIVNNIFYKIQKRNLRHLDYFHAFLLLPLYSLVVTFCVFP